MGGFIMPLQSDNGSAPHDRPKVRIVLERSQALGDLESLQARDRRAIRINFSDLVGIDKL